MVGWNREGREETRSSGGGGVVVHGGGHVMESNRTDVGWMRSGGACVHRCVLMAIQDGARACEKCVSFEMR